MPSESWAFYLRLGALTLGRTFLLRYGLRMHPLIWAFSATICFASASTLFTEYSRKISPMWMNAFKATVALVAFGFTLVVTNTWFVPSTSSWLGLLLSGLLGLMIGDLFMLKAMAELGASRMLMVFGLQPFLLGLGAYFLFSQSLSPMHFLGVIAMLACLFTFSLENYKKKGHWQLLGLVHALIAVLLDATGVLLTRMSFEQTPGLPSMQANFIRCVGASFGFLVVHLFMQKIPLRRVFMQQARLDKYKIMIGALGGTYFSLMLYLTAVSKGNLSVVSAVTVTGPMFAAIIESLWHKQLPSRFTLMAFVFFVIGFYIFIGV